ncbi:MAG: rRNA pseudouridine synthase [Alphaproteobacteria bacterium]|nr:rRNA pseudouridine synthase [Alphaproteobacteria bacterium]
MSEPFPDKAGERIAKRLARAGLCSRREAERWIAEGRVAVDGRVLDSAAVVVTPDQRVTVDGRTLPVPAAAKLWRYHKPKGLLVTERDPHGRPTVFQNLPPQLGRLVSVGRLDFNSEGLLLLSNDGALARHLELPATGWTRRYRVRVHGVVDVAALARLSQGATIDGLRYGPIDARLDSVKGSNAWLTMALQEGKNREVRKLCQHLGLTVTRLIRVAYGPFQLGELPEGSVAEIAQRVLAAQLGQAGRALVAGPARRDAHRRRPA